MGGAVRVGGSGLRCNDVGSGEYWGLGVAAAEDCAEFGSGFRRIVMEGVAEGAGEGKGGGLPRGGGGGNCIDVTTGLDVDSGPASEIVSISDFCSGASEPWPTDCEDSAEKCFNLVCSGD